MGVGGVWVQLLGGQGVCSHVILVLCECIWNAHTILLVLSALENASSLGSPLHQVVYAPCSRVPTWVTASRFLQGIGRLT